mmetsp:Transcript_134225/g.236698  ORF Transcript_134225/g.236698 Transcript_134225/m.236698 type:complete len:93 (-) Transcript_134225:37-315(-)
MSSSKTSWFLTTTMETKTGLRCVGEDTALGRSAFLVNAGVSPESSESQDLGSAWRVETWFSLGGTCATGATPQVVNLEEADRAIGCAELAKL